MSRNCAYKAYSLFSVSSSLYIKGQEELLPSSTLQPFILGPYYSSMPWGASHISKPFMQNRVIHFSRHTLSVKSI